MSDLLTWTDDEWNRVRQTVHDEAMRARVAEQFLPLFGPLPPDTQMVPANTLDYSDPGAGLRMTVTDFESIRLATLSVNVYLKNAQVSDPELTSALIMFRRAADIVARIEDATIFNGQKATGEGPKAGADVQQVWKMSGGQASDGLIGAGQANKEKVAAGSTTAEFGQNVFQAIVRAINKIEAQGHHGPFACAMGDDLFTAITTPMPDSMVLPRDSILPFLDAPLLRSSAVPKKKAVLVSLHGAPVEIVQPNDISVRYLQATPEAEHVFRVQQRFVLRVKEARAVATIEA